MKFGSKHTEESKQKDRESHLGRKLSEEHKRKISEGGKGKVLSLEARKHIAEAKIGTKNPQFGKPLTLETKLKISKAQKGKFFSKEHRRKLGDACRGAKHYLWKGGVTPIKERIRLSGKYQFWRQQIFLRDDFTCQECGQRGISLEAHHKKPLSKLLEQAASCLPLFNLYDAAMLYAPLWDIQNGKTLCVKCHNKTKRGKPCKKR